MGKMNLLKWKEDGIVQKLNLIGEMAPELVTNRTDSGPVRRLENGASCMRSVAREWMERKNENVSAMREWKLCASIILDICNGWVFSPDLSTVCILISTMVP